MIPSPLKTITEENVHVTKKKTKKQDHAKCTVGFVNKFLYITSQKGKVLYRSNVGKHFPHSALSGTAEIT